MMREAILSALANRLDAQRAPWPELRENEAFTLLVDGEESVIADDYGTDIATMVFGVRRSVSFEGDDESRSTAANQALTDLIRETLGTDLTLGGLCRIIRYTSGNTDYPADCSQLVGALATFEVDYELIL